MTKKKKVNYKSLILIYWSTYFFKERLRLSKELLHHTVAAENRNSFRINSI
jgi:hypothetical protein